MLYIQYMWLWNDMTNKTGNIFGNAIGIIVYINVAQMKNINDGHFRRNQPASGRVKQTNKQQKNCFVYYSVLLCWFLFLFLFIRSFWFEFKSRTVRQTRKHFYAICILANQYANESSICVVYTSSLYNDEVSSALHVYFYLYNIWVASSRHLWLSGLYFMWCSLMLNIVSCSAALVCSHCDRQSLHVNSHALP